MTSVSSIVSPDFGAATSVSRKLLCEVLICRGEIEADADTEEDDDDETMTLVKKKGGQLGRASRARGWGDG